MGKNIYSSGSSLEGTVRNCFIKENLEGIFSDSFCLNLYSEQVSCW